MKSIVEKRRETINRLFMSGIIRRRSVVEAMMKVPREEFVPPQYREYAHIDTPIPIGEGQTTSALHMTGLLCEYAELKEGMNVLEIGGGSGYMAAVYSELVSRPGGIEGHVYTIEIIKKLAKDAKRNLNKCKYSDRVDVIVADGSLGGPFRILFDAIIVTAAAPPSVINKLASQLRPGGKLVAPVGEAYGYQELILIEKKRDGSIVRKNLGPVAFVPLRGVSGWNY